LETQVLYTLELWQALGVGKSSIMLRFVTGNFSEHSEPTLGGAFMAKLFNHEGTSIKYQVLQKNGLVIIRYGIQLVKKNIIHLHQCIIEVQSSFILINY
jgi:GTPase SAR1 and related small G proteins